MMKHIAMDLSSSLDRVSPAIATTLPCSLPVQPREAVQKWQKHADGR